MTASCAASDVHPRRFHLPSAVVATRFLPLHEEEHRERPHERRCLGTIKAGGSAAMRERKGRGQRRRQRETRGGTYLGKPWILGLQYPRVRHMWGGGTFSSLGHGCRAPSGVLRCRGCGKCQTGGERAAVCTYRVRKGEPRRFVVSPICAAARRSAYLVGRRAATTRLEVGASDSAGACDTKCIATEGGGFPQ